MSAAVSSSSSAFEMDPADYAALLKLPGNKTCVDCKVACSPDWGSPKLGILFCLDCSGKHRGLGTHISFVRSVTMDSWTTKQMLLMRAGGNQACNDFLQQHGIDITGDSSSSSISNGASSSIRAREKYDSPAAQLYQQVLQARVDGTPEPTELPAPTVVKANDTSTKKMQGFGSSPIAPLQQQSKNKGKKKRIKKILKKAALPLVVVAGAVAATALWFLRR